MHKKETLYSKRRVEVAEKFYALGMLSDKALANNDFYCINCFKIAYKCLCPDYEPVLLASLWESLIKHKPDMRGPGGVFGI